MQSKQLRVKTLASAALLSLSCVFASARAEDKDDRVQRSLRNLNMLPQVVGSVVLGNCQFSLKKESTYYGAWELSVFQPRSNLKIQDRVELGSVLEGRVSASWSYRGGHIQVIGDEVTKHPNKVTIDLKQVTPATRMRRYSLGFHDTWSRFRSDYPSSLRIEEWDGFGTFAKKTLDFHCR